MDLRPPARRRQPVYWASIIASIMLHGGFLAYVVFHARAPVAAPSRVVMSNATIDVIEDEAYAPLQRGDREDIAPSRPIRGDAGAISFAYAVEAKGLAQRIYGPLPEDTAIAARSRGSVKPAKHAVQPQADADPPHIPPETLSRSTARRSGVRMSSVPEEEKMSTRLEPDPDAAVMEAVDAKFQSPGWNALVSDEAADLGAGSHEARAAAPDAGTERRPGAALPPNTDTHGVRGFSLAASGPLPEDRSVAPREAPESGLTAPQIPPPVKRMAHIGLVGERWPESDGGRSVAVQPAAAAGLVRAYRAKVRRHLAAHRPAGNYGSGQAVVAFTLTTSGRVASAKIAEPSGRSALDRSVVQSVYRSQPFPKPPTGLNSADLRFRIPFEFR